MTYTHDEEQQLLTGKLRFHTWKTHVSVAIIYICCMISSGPLMSFPTIEPLLIGAGVFSNFCDHEVANNGTGCSRQETQLGTLYNVSLGISIASFIFLGIMYDKLGARLTACIGAVGTSIGLGVLALSIQFKELNYLAYLGLTISTSMGYYNSFALYGFIWHYPEYQAFIIGLANSSTLMSAMMANVLVIFDKADIHIVEGLIIFAVLSLVAAGLSWIFSPSPKEFYERAEMVTGHKGQVSRSIIRDIKDAWACMKAYKKDNLLFFFASLTAYCYVIFWVAQFYPFEQMFLKSDKQAYTLSLIFAVVFALLGALLSPFLGLILDKIGMANFYLFIALSLVIFTGFLYVPLFSVQIISLVCGIVYVSVYAMFLGKWAVYYAPPELLGTFYGIMFSVFGTLQLIINTSIAELLLVHDSGLSGYFGPFIVFGVLSLSLQFVFYIFLKKNGLPSSPPVPVVSS